MPGTSTSGPGKGKSNNLKGKPKGTLNRTTKEARELLEQILLGQVDNIKEALEKLKINDPARYLDSCSKLFTYVLPKKSDITTGGEKINVTFTERES
jgi:hypothetical protein